VFVFGLVVVQLVVLLFVPFPGNLLAVRAEPDLVHTLEVGRSWMLAAASLAIVVVLAARWRAASKPRRKALLPGLVGGVSALLYTAFLVNGVVSDTMSRFLWWSVNLALLLVPAAYLLGLLRSRLARSGLAGLLLELGSMRGEALRAALAKTLADSSLEVVHAGADGGLPEAGGGRSVAPIDRDGRPVAALVYDASLDDDPELVEAVRAAAAIALENDHLQLESQRRLVELRASRERLVAAGDEERRRLERNLHDGAQQRLVALSLQLRLIQGRIRGGDSSAADELVDSASDELAQSLEELRELARGIHPAVLNHGLPAALESLADRSPVPTAVSYDGAGRLPEAVELAAYFVASEALTNVAKYARATAASVRLSTDDGVALIEIADNGVGGASPGAGSGLRGLADRVEALDGHLHVSSPSGRGTVVAAELPCGA
jgi:signal transduction histidine kinase